MSPMNPRLLRPIASGDPDARRYIAAVQQADGATLEPAVRKAINDFVVGCKADGIWGAIESSCILMGARTLSGALTPLVGSAPTNVNNNFVDAGGSGDYGRKTGLQGNGTNKSLNTNYSRGGGALLDNIHFSVFATNYGAGQSRFLMGNVSDRFFNNGATDYTVRCRSNTNNSGLGTVADGFLGCSRDNSANYIFRAAGTNATVTQASSSGAAGIGANFLIFDAAGSLFSGRIRFYSVGASLDLALLDSRVSALSTAIGAAIP